METVTLEEATQSLEKLITLAKLERQQFRITSEEGTGILLSEETYHNLMITLEFLSTPGLLDNLKTMKG